uniref:Phospholipid-transporting ATPase n=1 Tax=Albugo laibachii Nc14 TaxID=890382 RepID=F0W600_9STRA|nr:hypothetical protein SELMODRAFT_168751 [Albugo laibachii Nc14]|eukprot:CCA16542.1 hypothetical protein SELMODRAFT_168751 [Albugo laibachii Nc14]
MVDAVFAILEDRKRHRADDIANARLTDVFDKNENCFKLKRWSNVAVGDIIKVENRDLAPADIVILATYRSPDAITTGICYVETKSLDGETNLKIRNAMNVTMFDSENINNLHKLRGRIECEHPNNNINTFQGVLILEAGEKEPITHANTILRGCILRNSKWVYGLVFNTGRDTKIMQGMTAVPAKMSSMDRLLNKYILMMLLVLLTCSILGASGCTSWNEKGLVAWYLGDTLPTNHRSVGWMTMFSYYFLLMYQFIPISLNVSMSMVKFLQAQFIQWDKHIYHEATDSPALVRSMSLNEELGQVSYIFTDKTGTLTCNVMDFRKCSIAGISYGHGTTEIGLAAKKRSGGVINMECLEQQRGSDTRHVNFDGPELFMAIKGEAGKEQRKKIERFFTHLAICHSVTPEVIEGSDEVTFSASSPDEQALVAGASYFGYQFVGRTPGTVQLQFHGVPREFEILEVFAFTSARARMSTIVRHPNGMIVLYTKGADNALYPRLENSDSSQLLQQVTRQHINDYAEEGLRTLIIAMRDIDVEYYERWRKKYYLAKSNLVAIERQKEELDNDIDDCMNEIEVKLELLGATAIEDRLQKGVPKTLSNLSAAGIKTWVLTGDKEETAINIGYACQLLTNDMKIIVMNSRCYRTSLAIREEIDAHIIARIAEIDASGDGKDTLKQIGFVIDGETLALVMKDGTKNSLATLSQFCTAVIACRVSPSQKAEVVALIKKAIPSARTLSIGDGANDVPMIQEAHIGVGISGQEGLQAVNSSDYAIAQFRFLERLILVHGRRNYKRLSTLALYIFYKNILLTMSQFLYAFLNGFSGQKFFLEAGVQIYNIVLTSLPVILLSVLDQDVADRFALNHPPLYYSGLQGTGLNKYVFVGWVLDALFQSAVITFGTILSYNSTLRHGKSGSMWLDGNTILTIIVFVANIKLLPHQHSFHWFNFLATIGSIAVWIVIALIAGRVSFLSDFFWSDMMIITFSCFTFWLDALLIPFVALLITFTIGRIKAEFYPDYVQLVKEVSKFKLDEKLLLSQNVRSLIAPSILHLKYLKGRVTKGGSGLVMPSVRQKRSKTTRKLYNGFAFSTDDDSNKTESRNALKSSFKIRKSSVRCETTKM